MPSLKDLKVRINSVKSTQKITSATDQLRTAIASECSLAALMKLDLCGNGIGGTTTVAEAQDCIVDLALEVAGGGALFKRNELERLYRDVRAGGFHPANSALVHEIVGKTALGVLGQEPRWG